MTDDDAEIQRQVAGALNAVARSPASAAAQKQFFYPPAWRPHDRRRGL
ncbi:MAG: hypothetical protein QF830_03460 [Rhodospirillales bacterium]|nr:hypothetical protein [Rhodospirillales bacterium]